MGLHRHTQCFGNSWLLFGVLFSICVFVGTPKIDEYLAFCSCYKLKKTNTQIKKWSFCLRIRVSVQTNHFFGNTNTQKTAAKEKNLHTEVKPSFMYLCSGVSVQRNHSLMSLTPTYEAIRHETSGKPLIREKPTEFLGTGHQCQYGLIPLNVMFESVV
jgi:hypothetical protein